MSDPCALEAWVVEKELNHVPMPGTKTITESLNIALGYGAKPAPGPAESAAGAGHSLFDGGLTRKKRAGQRSQERRIGRLTKQRNAPTSLTLRELLCAAAQPSSRGESSVIHDSPG